MRARRRVSKAIAALVAEPGFRGVIPAERADALAAELGSTVEALLPELLPFAAEYAIPPISSFSVGVVAQGTSGSLYLGANMEYVGTALSFSVHAEQSATTNAWLHGEEGLRAIAASHAPCGYCRQFLHELTTASKLTVFVGDQAPRFLDELLPAAFGPGDLGVTAALMAPQDHGLAVEPEPTDRLVLTALAAANASYAPYSGGFAGVALETASGAVYAGRYAENAAFNPSMSPLESALAMRALGGDADDALTRAVLVEASSAADQAGATREVLRLVSSVELEVVPAA
jgi:cytidine deaminase